MPVIPTPFGPIHAAPQIERYPSGALRSCMAVKLSPLNTSHGVLIPQYDGHELRKRQLPTVSFHENGMLDVLPLEEQVSVPTPLGKLPAEKLSFHPDGSLKRVFPLDGCLSGYWTQEDERKLAHPIRVETPTGPVTALVMTLNFNRRGGLRSLTLWPEEKIATPTPLGRIVGRIGIAWYDSGLLRSLEPAGPTPVTTTVGNILAYDPDANGITGDRNSLSFDESGQLVSVTTVATEFTIAGVEGVAGLVAPPMRISPMDGVTREPAPLVATFLGDRVRFSAEKMRDVEADVASITARRHVPLFSFSEGQPASMGGNPLGKEGMMP